MRRFAAIILLLSASSAWAQTPAPPASQQTRMLRCFATAHALGRLVDAATRNLLLVTNEASRGAGAEHQQVMLGMLASGTLADQQPALDLADQLELCVDEAVAAAVPDPASALIARATAAETQAALDGATGFSSDFERASSVINRVLSAAADPALQQAANGAYSRFGVAISEQLHRVRLRVSELIEKSTQK